MIFLMETYPNEVACILGEMSFIDCCVFMLLLLLFII